MDTIVTPRHVGILTSGGDCPGLNAAIRGIVRAGHAMGIRFTGFRDGFRGLVHDRTMELDDAILSGILTNGGTILGTSRDKPHRMMIGGKMQDMTGAIVDTYRRHHLDALVCLGGGGTQKNALHLKQAGLNILTLPKTIDNDVALTDITFGFDTALGIATEAIDRLHSTATSHRRIIVVEIMGHRAGWLALGAGIAGGADVILIPEIPYDIDKVTASIRARTLAGKRFSIVAVAEGAMSLEEAAKTEALVRKLDNATSKAEKKKAADKLTALQEAHVEHTVRLTRRLEEMVGQEARLTILGHLQRGGTPSAGDRVLATQLGTRCAELLRDGVSGVMVAARNGGAEPVPLEEVAGQKKLVPRDHPWVTAARLVGASFGD
ncbi:MAG: ATP-dependent 6-phosphofructokinase [Candidatus Sumerlaeia bacterium]|nr:ATP-dependent 6-phosphofructokinase [Candidatus Sumerlaeia bacterium]